VEDESDLAKLLQWTLESRGYQTVLAGDGRAALFQSHRLKPDLLILDLMLPELHGFDVCRALKASELTKRIPIIALTALTSTEDKVKGLALGLDDYITKPFEMRELIARVEVGLRRSREPANVSIS
jgi:DNA-binding response OmpR family regulator